MPSPTLFSLIAAALLATCGSAIAQKRTLPEPRFWPCPSNPNSYRTDCTTGIVRPHDGQGPVILPGPGAPFPVPSPPVGPQPQTNEIRGFTK